MKPMTHLARTAETPGAIPSLDVVRQAQVQRQANLMAWHHSHRAHGLVQDRLLAVRNQPDEHAFWQAVERRLRPE